MYHTHVCFLNSGNGRQIGLNNNNRQGALTIIISEIFAGISLKFKTVGSTFSQVSMPKYSRK